MNKVILAFVLVAFWVARAAAGPSVTVAWDPNPPAENVTGYLVYVTQPPCRADAGFTSYVTEIDVGNVTQYTIQPQLAPGRNCFAAKAYNAAGLRSDYSVEVDTVLPLRASQVTGVGISYPTPGKFRVAWAANPAAEKVTQYIVDVDGVQTTVSGATSVELPFAPSSVGKVVMVAAQNVWGSGLASNPVRIISVPNPPAGFRINIVIDVQPTSYQ